MFKFKLLLESLGFAAKALRSNLLRTILSLLGVTIGIFSVIAALTLVDSLEKNVRDSLSFLGNNVIYIDKWPFTGGNSRDWWKDYLKRPNPSYKEYKFLKSYLTHTRAISIFAGRNNITVKNGNNSINKIRLEGASLDFEKIFDLNIKTGRYLTHNEIESGRNCVVLGYEVAKALFPTLDISAGYYVKIKNLKFAVVGVLEREGESFIGNQSDDYSCFIPYNAYRKLIQTGTGQWDENGSHIGLRGVESDIGLVKLENEVRGMLRTKRGLKPSEKDNFELNRPEAIGKAISGIFGVLSIAGWVIGGFSMLVGGFGIANIMFVSVKERTSIIGLQKSLGAQNYFILTQFLFESIFLSLIGGLAGLFLVWSLTLVPLGKLELALSMKNLILGIGVSSVIGLIAGIIPAAMASKLDPVAAIRSA